MNDFDDDIIDMESPDLMQQLGELGCFHPGNVALALPKVFYDSQSRINLLRKKEQEVHEICENNGEDYHLGQVIKYIFAYLDQYCLAIFILDIERFGIDTFLHQFLETFTQKETEQGLEYARLAESGLTDFFSLYLMLRPTFVRDCMYIID